MWLWSGAVPVGPHVGPVQRLERRLAGAHAVGEVAPRRPDRRVGVHLACGASEPGDVREQRAAELGEREARRRPPRARPRWRARGAAARRVGVGAGGRRDVLGRARAVRPAGRPARARRPSRSRRLPGDRHERLQVLAVRHAAIMAGLVTVASATSSTSESLIAARSRPRRRRAPGAVTSRQRAAPASKTAVTYAGSAARSAYLFCSGSSTATTASVTAALRAPYVVMPSAEPPHAVEDVEQVGDAGLVVRRTVRRPGRCRSRSPPARPCGGRRRAGRAAG